MTALKVSEADFTATVIEMAQLAGWRVAHFRPCRTAQGWRTAVQGDGAGFPDLVMVKPPRLIIAELKSETGRLSKEQIEWVRGLREISAAIDVEVWRPSDMDFIKYRLGIEEV